MEYRTATFYKQFHCIGGVCEDSCCENWEIDLDEGSLKNYMKQKGDFGKRLKKCTRVKDKQFILNGTRCPFLNDKNLCDIFIEMGESSLCETCTNFPRHVEEFDNLKEVSLTMSCPEVSRIMLARTDKMEFVCEEGTNAEYGLKDVETVRSFAFWKKQHENKLDKALFDQLYEVRNYMFSVLQNREMPIFKRAAVVLMFGYELQQLIDDRAYERISDLIVAYQSLSKQEKLQAEWMRFAGQADDKERFMKQVLNMYEGLETIKEEWTAILKDGVQIMHGDLNYENRYKAFRDYYSNREYEFEHILVYYLFNYFLGAAYDHDAFTKVKLAILSYLVILELDIAMWHKNGEVFSYEDQVLVAHAYSKEVEHSYNNFESLQLVLSAHPILDVEHILQALLA